jgi:glutamine amidotransferase
VRPAWNERNLSYLAKKVESSCIFAHVRAASLGEVSEANCHPFHFKNLLFMHNGEIEGFPHFKRYLRQKLSDEIYSWIRGQTDSEHLFALFLECLKRRAEAGDEGESAQKSSFKLKSKTSAKSVRGSGGKVRGQIYEEPRKGTFLHPSAEMMVLALEDTIQMIDEIKELHDVGGDLYINVAITDGRSMIALRYVSTPKEKAPTLYYSEGAKYECHDGICRMVPGLKSEHAVLVVSEKLTNERHQWKELPSDHVLLVDDDLAVATRPFRAQKREARKAQPSNRNFGQGTTRKVHHGAGPVTAASQKSARGGVKSPGKSTVKSLAKRG